MMQTLFGPEQTREAMTRRATVALVAGGAFLLLVAIPTALIDTPLFSREIPPTWWSWPALVVSAALAGLLVATYVRPPSGDDTQTVPRHGIAGGALMFFAVGCPVCNKLVLLALGSAGAMSWFAPIQPLLVLGGIAALAWALHTRLANQRRCLLVDSRRDA